MRFDSAMRSDTPMALMRWAASMKRLTTTGASPSKGSSRRRIEGPRVRARAMATIFFCPPERKRPRRAVKVRTSGNSSKTRGSIPPPLCASLARAWLIWKFSATVRSGKIPASSGAYPMPPRARSCAGSLLMSRPLKVTVPLFTGSRPMMLSMVVVFPAPLRPTRQTVSASPTRRATSRSTWAGPRKVLMRDTSSMAVRPQHVGGDLLVVADLLGGAVGKDGALVHGHDARTVREDHVHVVLDDDRGDPLRAHHVADDVHDGRLLARAHPARGLVQEEELGAEGVGHRHVEELPLALGEAAREHARLGEEPELLEDLCSLAPHGAVGLGEGEEPARLALARKDGQGHVVHGGKLVEEVDELEAPRDPRYDFLVDARPGDVALPEPDGAGVRLEEPADHVDESGFPRAVGADEGKHFALAHGEVHAIHGVRVAKVLRELSSLEQAHEAGALAREGKRRATMPMMPLGSASTRVTRTTPRNICQYTV